MQAPAQPKRERATSLGSAACTVQLYTEELKCEEFREHIGELPAADAVVDAPAAPKKERGVWTCLKSKRQACNVAEDHRKHA
mmetsp:Transcript_76574/g.215367  ORF Transcript_76574/g.215367 Transcript_76574/m.215367 type:complete len:82 (-) Transcript_76574:227-472(-)